MDKTSFEHFILQHPKRKFNLHHGFAGFGYGMPSNPKWITNERAFNLLLEYEKLTGKDPIKNYETLWYINTLVFEKKAWWLRIKTWHRFIGFNLEDECLYGGDGLG